MSSGHPRIARPGRVPDLSSGMCFDDIDDELWFTEGTGKRHEAAVVEAKRVCGLCPVKDKCREWALETEQPYGIFGGLTPDERALIRKRRARNRTIQQAAS